MRSTQSRTGLLVCLVARMVPAESGWGGGGLGAASQTGWCPGGVAVPTAPGTGCLRAGFAWRLTAQRPSVRARPGLTSALPSELPFGKWGLRPSDKPSVKACVVSVAQVGGILVHFWVTFSPLSQMSPRKVT